MKVHVNGIGFSYGKTPVLRDVSFDALPGQVTTIVGPNGAGKTTLLKCIADLFRHEGTVEFNGEVMEKRGIPKFMSYMEQNTDCEADLNVFEVVLLGMVQSLSFYISPEDVAKVNDVLRLLGISQYADRKIGELSGGQRQLVFIAQALVKDPKVLIMDEPTSALDLYHQFNLIKFISKITKERGCTTIMTLHHLDVALKYSDRVVVIANNTVWGEGTPGEMFTESMLADVYRMKANIILDEKGDKHLQVLEPIDETNSDTTDQCKAPHGEEGKDVIRSMNDHHRPQIEWGIANLPESSPKRILDIGCGGGVFIRYMLDKYPESVGDAIDISETSVKYCREFNSGLIDDKRLQVTLGNVSHMPYGDGTFDMVVSNASYFFWDDLGNDLKEVARVMTNSGILCLTARRSIDKDNIETMRSENEHGMNILLDSELMDMVERAGFDTACFVEPSENYLAIIGRKR